MKLHYLYLRGAKEKYIETYEKSSYASAEALADAIQADWGIVAKESFDEMLSRVEIGYAEENPLFWNPRTRRLEEDPAIEDLPTATLMEIAKLEVGVELLHELSTHELEEVRLKVARNASTSEDDLWDMSQNDSSLEVRRVARATFRDLKEAGG